MEPSLTEPGHVTETPGRPFVTVIMPIRNEARFIRESLGAVLCQDYPAHRLEVIIADGASEDETRDIIAQMIGNRGGVQPEVFVIDNPGGIVPSGFNEALSRARGHFIVRVDGHTIVRPDYVSECIAALDRTGADNVGGRMEAIGLNEFGRAVSLATSSRFGVGGSRFHYSDREEWVDTVYLGAWPREVFQRFGVFDIEFVRNQDDEFNYRLRSQGGRVLLSPRIRSSYYNRSTLRSLWRQYFQYGLWKVRVMQKHPRQMSLRHFTPVILVISVFASLAGALFFENGKWAFCLIAGTYLIANLLASVLVARKGAWRLLPVLPAAFAIIHFAYGSGFLIGLFKFRRRWRDRGTLGTTDTALLREGDPSHVN